MLDSKADQGVRSRNLQLYVLFTSEPVTVYNLYNLFNTSPSFWSRTVSVPEESVANRWGLKKKKKVYMLVCILQFQGTELFSG